MWPMLSLALLALNRDAFVSQDACQTTVDLVRRHAASTSTTSTSKSSTAQPQADNPPVPRTRTIVEREGPGAARRLQVRLLLFSCPAGRSSTHDR